MLHFFRRYQKIIFIIVTVIVIVTFVFFGTYQAFAPGFFQEKETVSYVTQRGHKVGSRYFNQLCQFLSIEDMGRDFFDTNFLSEKLISKEFLDTGIAAALMAESQSYLDAQFEKEKSYTPYVHPLAPHISAENVWGLFAPDMSSQLRQLQTASSSAEAWPARVALYQMQHQFPPQMLANMLRYQEHEAHLPSEDLRLSRADVALFGYYTIKDWFGPAFVERVAQIVIDTVEMAKAQGYKVGEEEALTEILYKSQKTVDLLKKQINRPLAVDGASLFQLYLRQGGYDEKTFLSLYRDIMLFKRYVQDAAESVLLDPLPFEDFYAHAGETLTVEVTQMPKEFRFQNREQLKEFEIYMAALTKTPSLSLPQEIHPQEEIKGTWYEIYKAGVTKDQLQSRVTVQETWRWQESNWAALQAQYPYLQKKENEPVLEVLDRLDAKRKLAVDAFARKAIVQSHPEWIDEAIRTASMESDRLFIANKEGHVSYLGISDTRALKQILDQQDECVGYTQDNEHYYRFLVRMRHCDQVLTFEEAKQQEILTSLQKHFDGEKLVQSVIACIKEKMRPLQLTDDEAIAYRFYPSLLQETAIWEPLKPIKERMTLTRANPRFFDFDQILKQQTGSGVVQEIGAYTYQVVDHGVDKTLPLDKIFQANELLSKQVRIQVLEGIIHQLAKGKE